MYRWFISFCLLQEISRPALSLAHRMRGKLHTVNKKISMIRYNILEISMIR